MCVCARAANEGLITWCCRCHRNAASISTVYKKLKGGEPGVWKGGEGGQRARPGIVSKFKGGGCEFPLLNVPCCVHDPLPSKQTGKHPLPSHSQLNHLGWKSDLELLRQLFTFQEDWWCLQRQHSNNM